MGIEIKRLYLENYKNFTSKEIVCTEQLAVFDGPNGYGKTSVFDAVEYIITGAISRIKESDVISGSIGYSSNFLAKNKEKDVILKGEFFNTNTNDKAFVIALCLPVCLDKGSRRNNPKHMDEQAETFFLEEYEQARETWAPYQVDCDTAQKKRNDYFGAQNLQFFSMLHYIHQEDRLAFFKNPEGKRTEKMQLLFGVEEEQSKLDRLDHLRKQLSKKQNELKEQITTLSPEMEAMPSDAESVEYVPLAGGKPAWDRSMFLFKGASSRTLYEEIMRQIEGVGILSRHKASFLLVNELQEFEKIPREERQWAILAGCVNHLNPNKGKELEEKSLQYDFLQQQTQLAAQALYTQIDYNKLLLLLGHLEWKQTTLDLVNQIKDAEESQSELQRAVNALIELRWKMHQQAEDSAILPNGLCPYCGENWQTRNALEEKFEQTQIAIESALDKEKNTYFNAAKRLRVFYAENCQKSAQKQMEDLIGQVEVQLFRTFPDAKTFERYAQICNPLLQRLGVLDNMVPMEGSLLENRGRAQEIEGRIYFLEQWIPENYYVETARFQLTNLYEEAFRDKNDITQLTEQQMSQKRLYVEDQYYRSFDTTRSKLEQCKEQKEKLDSLYDQVKIYACVQKEALEAYKKQVIKQIEIPFFLYSSRILQSYQEGQGILIQSDGKNVRFTAPGSEHDILYTMSSGQLSAVLLSFSLALSKIYAGNQFQMLLIDDPIQCMDDINMISFVELLQREFGNSQLLISTHEREFSGYLRYKFMTYNIPSQAIPLHIA